MPDKSHAGKSTVEDDMKEELTGYHAVFYTALYQKCLKALPYDTTALSVSKV
jgi:hypothetical protein